MKNIKKMGFALLLGLFAFGFSAFKSKQPKTVYFYYKVDPINYPNANDPLGYKYYDEDRCESGGALCIAQWDIATHPIPKNGDSLPVIGVTLQANTAVAGHFE